MRAGSYGFPAYALPRPDVLSPLPYAVVFVYTSTWIPDDMGIPSPAALALPGWGYALSRFGPVPVVDGTPAERR